MSCSSSRAISCSASRCRASSSLRRRSIKSSIRRWPRRKCGQPVSADAIIVAAAIGSALSHDLERCQTMYPPITIPIQLSIPNALLRRSRRSSRMEARTIFPAYIGEVSQATDPRRRRRQIVVRRGLWVWRCEWLEQLVHQTCPDVLVAVVPGVKSNLPHVLSEVTQVRVVARHLRRHIDPVLDLQHDTGLAGAPIPN